MWSRMRIVCRRMMNSSVADLSLEQSFRHQTQQLQLEM